MKTWRTLLLACTLPVLAVAFGADPAPAAPKAEATAAATDGGTPRRPSMPWKCKEVEVKPCDKPKAAPLPGAPLPPPAESKTAPEPGQAQPPAK